MDDSDTLAGRFEQERTHLHGVAYRMLGSASEADDAVQEAWLRLNRSDIAEVENLSGWLTTVIARICLDVLRSRKSRREESLALHPIDPIADHGDGANPEREAELSDSVGLAMLVVLETLTPAERLAFVLHDMFAVPYDEIAPIVGRTPTAARQLASRARRRVQEAGKPADPVNRERRKVVEAFLSASREGNFEALLAVLDPEIVVRADATARSWGSEAELRGADAVANAFSGLATAAKVGLVNGMVSAAWMVRGKPRVVIDMTIVDDVITAIDLIGDPAAIEELDFEVLRSYSRP